MERMDIMYHLIGHMEEGTTHDVLLKVQKLNRIMRKQQTQMEEDSAK